MLATLGLLLLAVGARAEETRFFTIPQCRLLDTRLPSDAPLLTGGVERAVRVSGLCGVPQGAAAVSVNVAVVTPSTQGYLRLYPLGRDDGQTSTVNFLPGAVASVAAIRGLSTGGFLGAWIPNYGGTTAHLVVDVNGYFSSDDLPAAGAQGPFGYQPLPGCRIVDTRSGNPVAAGAPMVTGAQGRCGIPAGAPAAALSAKAYAPGSAGWVLLSGRGSGATGTTLNTNPPLPVHSNGALTSLGDSPGDLTVVRSGSPTHLAIDAHGYFGPGVGLPFRPLQRACRALDQTLASGVVEVDLSCGDELPDFTDIQALAVTVTIAGRTHSGALTLRAPTSWPTSSTTHEFPAAGNLATGAIVSTDRFGKALLDLRLDSQPGASANARVIVDVFGSFGRLYLEPQSGGLVGTQVSRNDAPGFDPQAPFDFKGVDNVNLFNGNLVVTIPITSRFPVGPSLGYGLTLVNNSNAWSFEDHTLDGDQSGTTQVLAYPRPQMNAGFGWQLSLGRLYRPGDRSFEEQHWVYVGADGGEHVFFDKLHPVDAEDVTDVPGERQSYQYTRDGSYLRLVSGATEYVVEFPDGIRHFFDLDGRLDHIDDRFGNRVTLDDSNPVRWVITDTAAPTRSTLVVFSPLPGAPDSVSSVETKDGLITLSRVQLNYVHGPTEVIQRACPHSFNQEPYEERVQVAFLSSVDYYLGGTLSHSYRMEDYVRNAPANGPGCKSSGALSQLRLPTGGRIAWTYQDYTFPKQSTKLPISRSNGVRTRTEKSASSATLGVWTYTTAIDNELNAELNARELVNTVTDPLNNQTVNYFSVYAGVFNDPDGWTSREYGLPFTRKKCDQDGSAGPCTGNTASEYFLSTEVIPPPPAKGRRTFVRYEVDADSTSDGGAWEFQTTRNARQAAERVRYLDDGNRRKDTLRSGWDGVGHFQTVVLDGEFQAGSNKHTTVTKFPPRTFPINRTDPWVLDTYSSISETENGSSYTSFVFEPNTGFLSQRRVHASGTAAIRDNDVKVERVPGQMGFPVTVTYSGGDTADVFVDTHTYQCGVLQSTRRTGIDYATTDRGIHCALGKVAWSKDAAGQRTSFVYDGLGRMTEQRPDNDAGQLQAAWTSYSYFLPSGNQAGASATETVKSPTGVQLGRSERVFDDHGRLAKERRWRSGADCAADPLALCWDVRGTTYDLAGNVKTVSTWGRSSPGVGVTRYEKYDAFGRAGEIIPPDGPVHAVARKYYGDRVIETVSKVGRRLDAGGAILEDEATRTEIYDRMGRLWQVREQAEDRPQVAGSAPQPGGMPQVRCAEPGAVGGYSTDLTDCDVDTTYAYDEGGRLTRVEMTGDSGTQVRQMEYDARGFLKWENHPEKLANVANGHDHGIDYLDYDALGNPSGKYDGPDRLSFGYNKAGQLTLVQEGMLSGGRPLVEVEYGRTGMAAGKVSKAYRYNYRTMGATNFVARVLQQNTYNGKRGLLSSRTSALSFYLEGAAPAPEREAFLTGYSYNDLGQVTDVVYPMCAFPQCSSSPRAVTYGYTDGLMTSVGTTPAAVGFSAGFAYHPSGLWSRISRGNGRHTSLIQDSSGLARPETIRVEGPSGNIDLGPYSYDASGNVVRIVTNAAAGQKETYLYDRAQRLTSGTIYDGTYQSYQMDGFGNINEIGSSNSFFARSTPTNPATNRLQFSGYDDAGRMTLWGGAVHEYDALGALAKIDVSSDPTDREVWYHVYDADGERLWSFSPASGPLPRRDRWSLRDLGGRVLREFQTEGSPDNNPAWDDTRDYIYGTSGLLASITRTGGVDKLRYTHLDHLGSVRLFTTATGANDGSFHYLPYGEQYSIENEARPERARFTGHERDLHAVDSQNDLNETKDDLDYMHARYYRPRVGRFLSPDPLRGDPRRPQSLNRYTYVTSSPLTLVDPRGLSAVGGAFDIMFKPVKAFAINCLGEASGPGSGAEFVEMIELAVGLSDTAYDTFGPDSSGGSFLEAYDNVMDFIGAAEAFGPAAAYELGSLTRSANILASVAPVAWALANGKDPFTALAKFPSVQLFFWFINQPLCPSGHFCQSITVHGEPIESQTSLDHGAGALVGGVMGNQGMVSSFGGSVYMDGIDISGVMNH